MNDVPNVCEKEIQYIFHPNCFEHILFDEQSIA